MSEQDGFQLSVVCNDPSCPDYGVHQAKTEEIAQRDRLMTMVGLPCQLAAGCPRPWSGRVLHRDGTELLLCDRHMPPYMEVHPELIASVNWLIMPGDELPSLPSYSPDFAPDVHERKVSRRQASRDRARRKQRH